MTINDINEEWKDIEGFEGYYQISNLGNIKSLSRFITNGIGKCYKKGRVMMPGLKKNGYLQISLYKNKKVKEYLVHRLVAKHFIPNTENKEDVNHKNGIKNDNRVENLEWVTRKENINHAWKNNLSKSTRKKNVIQIENGKAIKIWDSAYEIQQELGFRQSNILKCCNGQRKSAYGYNWLYKNMELDKEYSLEDLGL